MTHKLLNTVAAIALSTAFVGCSQNDDPTIEASPSEYILFGQPHINLDATIGDFAGHGSRAGLTTSIDRFKVYGFCVPRSISDTSQLNNQSAPFDWKDKSNFFTAGADVFNGIEVTVGTDGFTSYNDNNFEQWHINKEARYTFIATSTSSGTFQMANAVATTGSAHGPRMTFTLPRDADPANLTEAQQQQRLSTTLDPNGQPDALVAARFDHQQADGRVNLSFFHFMTGLRFEFHNHTSDKDLVIKRVTFQGKFYRQGVFDFTTDKPDMSVGESTYSGTFTLLSEPQTILASSSDIMGSDANPVTLLLLPNPKATLDPEDGNDDYVLGTYKTITITYTIGGGDDRTFELRNFKLNYIPEANTLHTAHFNFVGDEFVVMFQADNNTNWGNGSDNLVDIK